MGTYTPKLNLYNPAEKEIGWKTQWDTNFSILDTAIGTYINANGSFKAATASAIPFSNINFTATNVNDAIIEVYNSAITTNWGDITGTLANQSDLQSALNAKQATLTAGNGIDISLANSISIDESEISASSIPFSNAGFTATNIYAAIIEGKPGAVATTSYTSDSVLSTKDNIILADASSESYTLTLPAASTATNMLVIKKTDSSMNSVTIDGYDLETIDGQTTYLLEVQYMYVALISDGNNWYIVANN